ncbi:glycosyltransferase [Candidatus Thioglobus sp.]|nr:glycosyltransferase [Candidatus Thioglobus sp.]
MSDFAPIVLFVYNRLKHTKSTVKALQKNIYASKSELFIFSDAPKNNENKAEVELVRSYLKDISGFKNVSIVERNSNFGLSKSIESGVTEVIDNYGKAIILEDDIVTAPYFLRYMNESLDLYEFDSSVANISGYTIPNNGELPETWFSKGANSWGWGTWKESWNLYTPDPQIIFNQLKSSGKMEELDNYIDVDFTQLFEDYIDNKISAWDIVWTSICFMNNKYTLYPKESLVLNIGNDGSGTNCIVDSSFDSHVIYLRPIKVSRVKVIDNEDYIKLYKSYVRGNRNIIYFLIRKYVKKYLKITRNFFK